MAQYTPNPPSPPPSPCAFQTQFLQGPPHHITGTREQNSMHTREISSLQTALLAGFSKSKLGHIDFSPPEGGNRGRLVQPSYAVNIIVSKSLQNKAKVFFVETILISMPAGLPYANAC